MVGGVAKNRMVVAMVERNLQLRLAGLGGFDPQLAAAYGAALMAQEGCSLDGQHLSNSAGERLRREGKH